MTESEAIKMLEIQKPAYGCKEYQKPLMYAYEMAIKALEKQIEMEKYCDENGCADCPYHNTSLKDNRCMNDFIIDKE